MLVVCGRFVDVIVWKISKDIIGMQKKNALWVRHPLLKCRSDTHTVVNLNRE
jgi:hypothetical protein